MKKLSEGVPRFVGLDVSITNTGYCIMDNVLSDEPALVGSVASSVTKVLDVIRFRNIIDKLVEAIEPNGYRDIYIFENYAYSSKGQITRIAELTGQLKQVLYSECGVAAANILTCSPSTSKKYILGTGKGDKNKILLQIYKRWGIEHRNDDEADAHVLGRLGQCLYTWWHTGGMEFHKYEVEVFKSVVKQNPYSFVKK